MHGLQSFVSTHSEESDGLLFILCLQQQMLLTSAFSKDTSAISLEALVFVCKVFTTATRKLRVKQVQQAWKDFAAVVTLHFRDIVCVRRESIALCTERTNLSYCERTIPFFSLARKPVSSRPVLHFAKYTPSQPQETLLRESFLWGRRFDS